MQYITKGNRFAKIFEENDKWHISVGIFTETIKEHNIELNLKIFKKYEYTWEQTARSRAKKIVNDPSILNFFIITEEINK